MGKITSLKDLDKDIMNEIGITKIGHQMKLLRVIRMLNNNNNYSVEYQEGGTAYI